MLSVALRFAISVPWRGVNPMKLSAAERQADAVARATIRRHQPHRNRMAKSASPAKKPPATRDLFAEAASPRPALKRSEALRNGNGGTYTAHDIEVLEGLEPVRRRPGMYIGGTDEKALHHLFAEVIDNA